MCFFRKGATARKGEFCRSSTLAPALVHRGHFSSTPLSVSPSLQASTHTCTRSCMHACIRMHASMSMHPSIHACIHIHAPIHACVHSHPCMHLCPCTHPSVVCINALRHPSLHLCTHLFTCASLHPRIMHPFSHSEAFFRVCSGPSLY